ncbi:MAG: hypothetical protein KKC68_03785 [Candidatus Thermoplasmatota archaeon]|nr:hypothetical protein [Candidatus Thermoplasmatota archaeon]MBU1940871.1 hypothetical protein [Candidatus Thermoplasmatota archaeon]
MNNTTDGEYNLFLKVRDPSRPGLQVLTLVPKGTTYKYPHPQTGKQLSFTVKNSYIGVATKGDTLPEIVKAGMSLSSVGLAYGDADTNSNWINPRKYAWDDFDWIRYACEQAQTEDDAVNLLTNVCVDQFHATGVSENLFVVGPQKGYLIEADAYRYDVKEIKDICVISNYPKVLWQSQLLKKRPIAKSFDTVKQQLVHRGQTIHLQSLFGVRITGIKPNSIIARQTPPLKFEYGRLKFVGKTVEIPLGERETVGDYSITLHSIQGKQAIITVENIYHAWEQLLLSYITEKSGNITLNDMFRWSRLHRDDLDGLRGICEPAYPYEAVMVYKIPTTNYTILSSGWFSANHACSSIYVPIHIETNDIYLPYTTGDAAQLSLDLVETWGHSTLIPLCEACETVLLSETEQYEHLILTKSISSNSSSYFTTIDTQMQQQAYATETIWQLLGTESNNAIRTQIQPQITTLWNQTYLHSIQKMTNVYQSLLKIPETKPYQTHLKTIINSIVDTRWYILEQIDRYNLSIHFQTKPYLSEQETDHDKSLTAIVDFITWSEAILLNNYYTSTQSSSLENQEFTLTTLNSILLGILTLIFILLILRKKSDF